MGVKVKKPCSHKKLVQDKDCGGPRTYGFQTKWDFYYRRKFKCELCGKTVYGKWV